MWFKNAMAYLALGLIHLFSFLPLPVARGIGAGLGWLIWRLNVRKTRISRKNIAICFPEWSEADREALTRQSLIDFGKTCAEMGMIWCGSRKRVDRLIQRVDGLEHLQAAKAQGKGIILLAPHLGNWEILNHFIAWHLQATAMYKPAKIPALDRFIYKTRKRVDVGLVPADRDGVNALFRLLDEGETVAVLPDQQPSRRSGVFAPFFGHTALTGKLTGELARHGSASLLMCYAWRLEDGRYGVCMKPGPEAMRDPSPERSAAALNQAIEDCVRACPVHYQWGYKRFKYQPDDQELLYR
ncbi:KDO2-lipid IV(A) lauroyltransferase [Tamilnaduibacter salinus]|uniref:KDO2-lipid IV(A) lauroyltransferase n=1 Tax=Tamilnaduibacter salinus TaxID=1484056 RepID=A0A2U1CTG4_9GAMM|nr:lysophospholipid acyltransferase family protein [Tamilnaduibacter salinus]PVY69991.1 KDO2-lipid IV(A) lauroyltransferase [Tamilnaduibacter salinus]